MLSNSQTLSPNVTNNGTASLQKTLVLWQLVMIGLAYMQPLTVFDTFGIVSDDTGRHVPTAYIITLVAMMFTALSYGKMVRRYPSAGSAYTYTQKSIDPNVGFVVGWCTLLDYLFSPMINILLATIYLKSQFGDVNVWYYVVPLAALMTYINYRGVEIVASFNSIIVFFQLLLMAIFIGLLLKGLYFDGVGAATLVSSKPFITPEMSISAVAAGSAILCFSFLGFDGLSSLSEEAKDAAKAVPKAIFLTTLIGGVIFIFITYFMQLFFEGYTFTTPEESQPEVLLYAGEKSMAGYLVFGKYVASTFFQSIGLWLAIFAVFASGLAAHTGVSRMMYVMGRDGILPKKTFGHISPRHKTPSFNILVVGIVSLSAGFFDLDFALHLVNFGALTAFFVVNVCVIVQCYYRDGQRGGFKNTLHFLILPLFGMLFIAYLWYNLEDIALKIGLVWAAIGIVYLAFATKGFRKYPKAFLDKKNAVD